MSEQNTKIYTKQGGAEQVYEDGAKLKLGANVTLTVSGTNVLFQGLPTADPSVAGALYSNAGVLTISAG
ncbi:hypothetical protein OIU34_02400 [Pararhizobium sp. BT-229]|uniref:hypothetical protein n=1 Tax=Pararhizobium sp. BT-229 TaxID=2986923 RepID=UPI0021F6C5BA|nr:hypothetical protein [Pararhizobium sp. BT-229]MCV9960738.1 hypothetical protein [Pararhizobium sp. BT-229]